MNQCSVRYFIVLAFYTTIAFSCTGKLSNEQDNDTAVEARTPVTVTTVSHEALAEYIDLNATSAFLQKNDVKAVANGYLQSVDIQIGNYVNRGQVLFKLKTKESESIGNSINLLDSSFKFSGVTPIRANSDGFVMQLNHQKGDYVQDGEQLAMISDKNSLVFLIDLPYELKPYSEKNKTVEVLLPDSEKLKGTLSYYMPLVDSASQTQRVVIRVPTSHPIPENLIAKVRLVKNSVNNALSLPKAAVLTNETQTDFWVMKLADSQTAVKVPVKKGIETDNRIEILSPAFSDSDKIVVSGNYGMSDTTAVKVE